MDEQKNIGAKVEEIIDHLRFNVFPVLKIKFTQKELSSQIDMAEGNITNAKKGDQRYINAFIEKVNDKFGNIINEEWYFSDKGEMLKTDTLTPPKNETQNKDEYIKLLEAIVKSNIEQMNISIAERKALLDTIDDLRKQLAEKEANPNKSA